MRYRMGELLKGLAALAALLLQIGIIGKPVWAAEISDEGKAATAADLDFARTGSVLVTLKTGAGETAGDGALSVYKIADLKLEDGDMIYVLTEEFQESGADLSDMADAEANGNLAKILKAWIADQKISGMETAVNSDGTVVLKDLTLGLYLVDQTRGSAGYYDINEFLVSVPAYIDGKWVYDVDAGPKTETLTEIPAQPPSEPTPDEETPSETPPDEETFAEENNENQPVGEIIHTGQLKWPVAVLLLISAVCMTACAALVWHNRAEDIAAGKAAMETIAKMEMILEEGEAEMTEEVTVSEDEVSAIYVDGCSYIGMVEIPSLELKLPVLAAWSYSGLKIAPCRYYGSAIKRDLIIAGHNYSSHFGPIRGLQGGEEVCFTGTGGYRLDYAVTEVVTIPETDGGALYDGDWDLTLFTCTEDGESRVAVRCRLKNK